MTGEGIRSSRWTNFQFKRDLGNVDIVNKGSHNMPWQKSGLQVRAFCDKRTFEKSHLSPENFYGPSYFPLFSNTILQSFEVTQYSVNINNLFSIVN